MYWALSQVDPGSLTEPSIVNRGRNAMLRLMFALGTPVQWGWFCFLLLVISGFVNDWYYFRFQNLPPYSSTEGEAEKRDKDTHST
jgi:hypothetical protein